MRVALVTLPPRYQINSVPASIPYVAGVLATAGHDVRQIDLNLELFEYGEVQASDDTKAESAQERHKSYIQKSGVLEDPKHALEEIGAAELILRNDPQVVGISVAFPSDVPVAAALLSLLRQRAYGYPHLVVGGSYAIEASLVLQNLADHFVYGSARFLDSFLERALLYRHSDPYNKVFSDNYPGFRGLYPLYDHELLARYPGPVELGIAAGYGCYWNACAFCDHNQHQSCVREYIAGDEIAAKLSRLHNEVSGKLPKVEYQVITECLTLPQFRELGIALLELGFNASWGTCMRADHIPDTEAYRIAQQAGCRGIFVGVESVIPRILKLMNKGTTVERTLSCLHEMSESGLYTFTGLIADFPTMQIPDFEQTKKIIEQHRPAFYAISAHKMSVSPDAAVGRNPGKYGITLRVPKEEDWSWDTSPQHVSYAEQGSDRTRDENSARVRDILQWADGFNWQNQSTTFGLSNKGKEHHRVQGDLALLSLDDGKE